MSIASNDSPLEVLAAAIHTSANLVFPAIMYETRDFEKMQDWTQAQRMEAAKDKSWPMVRKVRRPKAEECFVCSMFLQTWGSTALGFGGIGGAAITSAYTVVIGMPDGNRAVFWSGRLAYTLDISKQTVEQRDAFIQDIAQNTSAPCAKAVSRYGAALRA